MATLFFLLFVFCAFGFVIGLLKPSIVVRWTSNPNRKQVMLYYLLPSFVFLILLGVSYEDPLKAALKNPLLTTELSLRSQDLSSFPKEVLLLKNLVDLNLSKNKFTSIPEEIKSLKNLQSIDLSNNPIESIPNWVYGLDKVYKINLDDTNIDSLPNVESSKDLTFSYENTPLWRKENHVVEPENKPDLSSNENATKEKKADSSKDDRTESFGEFAFRSILGNEFGQMRKFGKGEMYYDHPVTIEEADAVGEIMQIMGFFNDETGASMMLEKEESALDSNLYVLKIMINDIDDVDDDMLQLFTALREMVSISALNNQEVHIHLTDDDFDTQKVIKP